jgi:hypothetical protein
MLVFSKHVKGVSHVSHRDGWYAASIFAMLVIGGVIASLSYPVTAQTPPGGCPNSSLFNEADNQQTNACGQAGSITISAVVPPARPTRPVTITSPTNGQTFTTNPVTVTGTCPSGYLVKIFSNGILIGSVICGPNGTFAVPADLVIGQNTLNGFAYNTLDQQGPSGNSVNVTLNQPAGGVGFSTELILQSVNYYRGVAPGQEVIWPIDIIGGQAPYAVSIDWGDGTTEVITRLAPGPFTVSHTYTKVGTGYLGTFPLIIRASDAVGHTAYLQLTTLVNGATGSTASKPVPVINKLIIIWPIWIVIMLMLLSYWLGKRREKYIMQKQLEALA